MGERRWVDLLDAIYDFDAPEPQWLSQLVDTSQRAFSGGDGAAAYRYDLSTFADVRRVAGPREIAGLAWAVHEEMPLEQVRAAYGATPNALPVSWSWATPEGPRLPPRYGRELRELGLSDGYAVLAPHGLQGLAIGIGMPRRRFRASGSASIEQLNVRWTSIARHLMTALRLRRAFSDGTALLELDARALSVANEHARRVDQARDDVVDDASGLDTWAGLLAGRWSLVRAPSSGARRRYFALENPGPERRLTPSEFEVVARARNGDALKHIALDLGVEESTVATSLSNALRKLGLRSRAELVQLAGALSG